MGNLSDISGGITAVNGFSACGVHAGIKSSKLDLAVLISDVPAAVAGVFTTNRIQGAPVKLCRERLAQGVARAVVINSGSANTCTGPQGMADAERMADVTAEAANISAKEVFVCSTGTIGKPLPMAKIEPGIRAAVATLSEDGGHLAATAIMTTDTIEKEVAIELMVDGISVRIGGMAKGSGMIEPNMATMLAFLTTDAAVDGTALQDCLKAAVAESFNRITVDHGQSTNDTVLFLANGVAGNTPLSPEHKDWACFQDAVTNVATRLAMKIVEDAEGATRFVTVHVQGAKSEADARLAARAVANSPLCKTAWYGGDPNWGRIVYAVGHCGADIDGDKIEVCFDDVCAVQNGCAVSNALKDMENVLAKKHFSVHIDLHMGDGCDTVYTCDFSEEYVKINSEYMT
ncbi:MAG: bifunctional glutamate N-acetyltransferase/amino-acid acetyltransferase ArgJ [Kiritimatiellae bacterium]|nr:bifunctional glutamate N-acetyltransferase/amino-acid acetyltransferase ArgJ [Kiritimatiellia bacterium]